MGTMRGFLDKARERELDRYAAGYAVAAWILIQAASIALPAYEMPPWLMRWLIAAAILGLPVLLIGVWILKKPVRESTPRHRGRDAFALAALAIVAMLTLGEVGWHLSKGGAPALIAGVPANASIAVLPFANTSSDPSQTFFSEGVAEELIGILARNPALRVAARTSSFAFEGKSMDARAIAQRLNVHSVLEGSVRAVQGRVRIDVDLINAADGYQIWAQSYDRPLQDILALQADIAQSIAGSLTPQLMGEPLRASLPKSISIDPDIYRTYLEAQLALDKRGDAIPEAVAKFEKVVKAVPDFAEAQAGLAYALSIQSSIDNKPYPEADIALANALRLDPTNPVALTVAINAASERSDWNAIIEYAARLRTAGSRSGIALHGLSNAYSALGFYDSAIATSREVERLDPMTDIALSDVAFDEFLTGRYEQALPTTEILIARQPDNFFYRNLRCNVASHLKKFEVSKEMLAVMETKASDVASVKECKTFIAINAGETTQAQALANDFVTHTDLGVDDGEVAWLLAATGQFDRAMDWFERAADENKLDKSMLFAAQVPEALHRTARWRALLDRPDFKKWSAARDRAALL